MRHLTAAGVCFGLAIATIVGCSGGDELKLVPAGGTLTYNGKPLAGASVTFTPTKGPVATATTGMDGKFTLSTNAKPGAAVGDYRVAVIAVAASAKTESVDLTPKEGAPQGVNPYEAGLQNQAKSLIPEKYNNHEMSSLAFTVKAQGENQFAVELKD